GIPCTLKAQGSGESLAELDRLYDQRLDIKPVQQLVEKCQALLSKNPNDYELLWRLSRAYFHLGREAQARDDKLTYYKKAVEVGRQAVEARDDRVEGHFWLGISIAAVGETTGIMKSLTSVGDVRREMEKVIALDDRYEDGGGYRIQGRLDHKVPRLFGGNKTRSHEYYQKALLIAPANTYTHLFLAELLIEEDRLDEATTELKTILSTKNDPKWAYDVKVNKVEARKLLEECEKERAVKKFQGE
ncbi:MAG: TRAP transporter TatT component family protein, partial [Candidatus Brocadiales bacterium]